MLFEIYSNYTIVAGFLDSLPICECLIENVKTWDSEREGGEMHISGERIQHWETNMHRKQETNKIIIYIACFMTYSSISPKAHEVNLIIYTILKMKL